MIYIKYKESFTKFKLFTLNIMDDSQVFLKVWKNALELVNARGYTYDQKYDTINEEEMKHLISNNGLFIMGEKKSSKILIKLVTISKVKSVNIK